MTSTINEINKINAIISENIEDPIFILNEKLTCEFVNFHDFKEKKNLVDSNKDLYEEMLTLIQKHISIVDVKKRIGTLRHI